MFIPRLLDWGVPVPGWTPKCIATWRWPSALTTEHNSCKTCTIYFACSCVHTHIHSPSHMLIIQLLCRPVVSNHPYPQYLSLCLSTCRCPWQSKCVWHKTVFRSQFCCHNAGQDKGKKETWNSHPTKICYFESLDGVMFSSTNTLYCIFCEYVTMNWADGSVYCWCFLLLSRYYISKTYVWGCNWLDWHVQECHKNLRQNVHSLISHALSFQWWLIFAVIYWWSRHHIFSTQSPRNYLARLFIFLFTFHMYTP